MEKPLCPHCGAALVSNSTESCPACLLELAAELEISGETTDFPKLAEPELEAIQAAFPQLEILEKVGRGGMGTVFKARQPKLDRFVALKILSPSSPHLAATAAHFSARFAREGKLLAKLSHPNIVTVYDFGQADGFYYLIMEFVEGVNLRQAMREERFTPEQALAIVPKICEALQYAHDEGVLHRDIKPENILLDAKGRVKIADFGIASVARWTADGGASRSDTSAPLENSGSLIVETDDEKLTQTGQVLGTPSYMAPEQREDPNRVDHRADIYSLGVVFYELLTGELPKGRFPLPSEKTPVDADIDAIVLKALNKEREKRQQSAGELKTEIETATQNHLQQTAQPDQARNFALGPWVALGISLVTIAILFCSTYYATGVYVPKWHEEGKVRFAEQKVRDIEFHLQSPNPFPISMRGADDDEIEAEKTGFLRYWLGVFQEKANIANENYSQWKRDNVSEIVTRISIAPLLASLMLGGCGYYVFSRLKKRNTQGIVPLVFTFTITMFFVPLSLQYVGCTLYSGDPGYWDDGNGEIIFPLYLLSFVIVVPLLVVFFRRAISATKNSGVRAKFAFAVTLASILVSMTAFAFVGIAGITHELRYRSLKEGEIAFMKENVALRNEFASGYKKIILDESDIEIHDGIVFARDTGLDCDLQNEMSWFTVRWESRPEYIERFNELRTMGGTNIPSILVALFFLSFVFAVPSGTVGTFLGIGYMKRNRPAVGEPYRRMAVASIAVIPLTALVLLFVGVIAWCALPGSQNDIGGICVIVAMVYLLLFAAVLGVIVFLSQNQKDNTIPPEPPPLPPEPKTEKKPTEIETATQTHAIQTVRESETASGASIFLYIPLFLFGMFAVYALMIFALSGMNEDGSVEPISNVAELADSEAVKFLEPYFNPASLLALLTMLAGFITTCGGWSDLFRGLFSRASRRSVTENMHIGSWFWSLAKGTLGIGCIVALLQLIFILGDMDPESIFRDFSRALLPLGYSALLAFLVFTPFSMAILTARSSPNTVAQTRKTVSITQFYFGLFLSFLPIVVFTCAIFPEERVGLLSIVDLPSLIFVTLWLVLWVVIKRGWRTLGSGLLLRPDRDGGAKRTLEFFEMLYGKSLLGGGLCVCFGIILLLVSLAPENLGSGMVFALIGMFYALTLATLLLQPICIVMEIMNQQSPDKKSEREA